MRGSNLNGEMLIANRETGNASVVLFDPTSRKFMEGYLSTDGGAVGWKFRETAPPLVYTDPLTGRRFAPALTTDGGAVGWTFEEVT